MLVARFRLAAPLSSLGVIVASMGQPNGGTEGRRARGKICDSARRSRQSTSKTATDASVRIMSLKPSFPPMPVTSQGSTWTLRMVGIITPMHQATFQVRHWLHALRRGVRADTLRMSRDSGRLDSGQDPGRLNGCPPARDLERLEKHWKYQVPGNVPSRSVGSIWNSRRGPFHPELL